MVSKYTFLCLKLKYKIKKIKKQNLWGMSRGQEWAEPGRRHWRAPEGGHPPRFAPQVPLLPHPGLALVGKCNVT